RADHGGVRHDGRGRRRHGAHLAALRALHLQRLDPLADSVSRPLLPVPHLRRDLLGSQLVGDGLPPLLPQRQGPVPRRTGRRRAAAEPETPGCPSPRGALRDHEHDLLRDVHRSQPMVRYPRRQFPAGHPRPLLPHQWDVRPRQRPGLPRPPRADAARARRRPRHARRPDDRPGGPARADPEVSPSPVEFGFALPDLAGIGPQSQRIEALGYDYLAMGEHVAFHGPTPNSFVGLAVAAASTRRIKVLSSVVLLPLYPAALAAKLAAALDVVAGGRYTMGVGVGGEYPPEFEACGVPVAERGQRCNEALDVIRRLWQQPPVTYHGRFSHFTDVSIRPGPVQRPSIPIWVSGRSTAAMRRAAQYGDGWMPYMYTPDMVAESAASVSAAA